MSREDVEVGSRFCFYNRRTTHFCVSGSLRYEDSIVVLNKDDTLMVGAFVTSSEKWFAIALVRRDPVFLLERASISELLFILFC